MQPNHEEQTRFSGSPRTRLLWTLLIIILSVRLLTMALYPILDTTEARYVEISRLMLVSGDWVMPQFQPGVPFWGKPPLFAWMTADSLRLFGMGEFAARLPHFLLGLGTLLLVMLLAIREMSPRRCVLALVILASTPLFFASVGTVMTESGLMVFNHAFHDSVLALYQSSTDDLGFAVLCRTGAWHAGQGPGCRTDDFSAVNPLGDYPQTLAFHCETTLVERHPVWAGDHLALVHHGRTLQSRFS